MMIKKLKMADTLENSSYCRELVEKYDHDRFLTVLYAPAKYREPLFGLYSFNYEISRIRETVSEPMLGEIKLQWWREAIEDVYQGNIRNHDVLTSLSKTIKEYNLSQGLFMSMIEGRSQDLYDNCPANEVELEGYITKTSGNLAVLAGQICGQYKDEDIAQALGQAWGYIGIIRSVAYHASLKKNYIPQTIMETHSHGKVKYLSPDQPQDVREIISLFCHKTESHLELIRARKKDIEPSARAIFLLSSLARSYLKTIKKADYNPFALEEKADAGFRHMRLFMSALFNRI